MSANAPTRNALLLAVQGIGRASAKNQDAQEQGLSRRIRMIPVAELHKDPTQPRRAFDEDGLERLADTIKAFGVLSPIVVSARDEGGSTIVLGERRFRGALQAGLTEVPTITVGALSPREKLELQLLENVSREDLNVVEEGRGYARLVELGATQREVAQRVGRSEASVSRALAIATKLPREWLDEAEARPDLASPSKLYELAQTPEGASRDALWAQLREGASREELQDARRDPTRRGFPDELERSLDELVRDLRQKFRAQVDGRRINRRALTELALRRLVDGWDEKAAREFLRSVGE